MRAQVCVCVRECVRTTCPQVTAKSMNKIHLFSVVHSPMFARGNQPANKRANEPAKKGHCLSMRKMPIRMEQPMQMTQNTHSVSLTHIASMIVVGGQHWLTLATDLYTTHIGLLVVFSFQV